MADVFAWLYLVVGLPFLILIGPWIVCMAGSSVCPDCALVPGAHQMCRRCAREGRHKRHV